MERRVDQLYFRTLKESEIKKLDQRISDKFRSACLKVIINNSDLDLDGQVIAAKIHLEHLLRNPDEVL